MVRLMIVGLMIARSPIVAVVPMLAAVLEPLLPRLAPVGTSTVWRYLPARGRPTVGAWCFLDRYGPEDVSDGPGMQVGPHPHTGLQTVTWLFDGEVVHRDSLGNLQTIRPGQLNLMTAGHGIAHAERSPDPHPRLLHGLQCWVALPEHARDGAPAFEHHEDLPDIDLGGAHIRLLVGDLAGAHSPATTYSPLVGAEVRVGPEQALIPLESDFEHALVVVGGSVGVDGALLDAGTFVYLGRGRSQLTVSGEPSGFGRLLLLGGEPFTEPLVMWWNFVGRSNDEIVAMRDDWEAGRRFGVLGPTAGAGIPAPPLPPGRIKPRS